MVGALAARTIEGRAMAVVAPAMKERRVSMVHPPPVGRAVPDGIVAVLVVRIATRLIEVIALAQNSDITNARIGKGRASIGAGRR
ncbi:hypothetical protein GCM10020258_40150 [Sphingomonas yabuuchiae]